MPLHTLPIIHANKERQRISMENQPDNSTRYTSSDDSEHICNKKVKADKLAAVKSLTTDLAVIALHRMSLNYCLCLNSALRPLHRTFTVNASPACLNFHRSQPVRYNQYPTTFHSTLHPSHLGYIFLV